MTPPPTTMRCGERVQTTLRRPSATYSASSCQTRSSPASSSGRLPQRRWIAPPDEPLEAVAVKRTDAVERIGGAVVRDPHVPELGMDQAVHQLAVHHAPAADPGADGDVAERLEPGACAPAVLAERGCVDIGVEGERHAERAGERRVVMRPHVGEPRLTSIGPNEPRPIAASVPSRAKNSAARAIVSSGSVVGKVTSSWTSSGPVPVAQTHFVPPASTPP
jgi:hypothetical protein